MFFSGFGFVGIHFHGWEKSYEFLFKFYNKYIDLSFIERRVSLSL